jgi:hypothetical protein
LRAARDALVRGEALTSPEAVRSYLRLALAARESEAFVGLFLDSQQLGVGECGRAERRKPVLRPFRMRCFAR